MIPVANISEWRHNASWADDAQVEQDLVISRALVEIFANEQLACQLAFRGGTALHKLYVQPTARYSEDIDLVALEPDNADDLADLVNSVLQPWLGERQLKQDATGVVLRYGFRSEIAPIVPLQLKVEINLGEPLSILGFTQVNFEVDNQWWSGKSEITTYHLNELLATKLRALHQRNKGRDLFDIWHCLEHEAANPGEIIRCFIEYMTHCNQQVSGHELAQWLQDKLDADLFVHDTQPLLAPGIEYDHRQAGELVIERLFSLIP